MKFFAALLGIPQPAPAIVQEVRIEAPAQQQRAQLQDFYISPPRRALEVFHEERARHTEECAIALAFEAFMDAHVAQSSSKNGGKKARAIARYYVAREA